MAFECKTAKMLSTSGLTDEGNTIFRVSLWAGPDDLEIDPEDSGDGPTIRVKVSKGRMTIYGRIDRDAWRHHLTKDDPMAVPAIPMPTEAKPSSPLFRAVFGGGEAPVNATPPKPVSQPLFSRAKALPA